MLESQNDHFILDKITIETGIKSVDSSKLIFIEKYFCSNGHHFYRPAKFAIIKESKKDINIKSMTEKHKDK